MKKRLDLFLVEKGFYKTRERAQKEIKNKSIEIDGKVEDKPSFLIDENANIKILADTIKYVSRAGLKLEKAKQYFNIDFNNKVVLDIGASTGGFTDFCIKNGAKKVYSVDVGTNQLDESLKQNSKVVNLEKTDIRNITSFDDKIDMAVCDVSFISLTKIGDAVKNLLKPNGEFVALIKPQFECGPKLAKKFKGVIGDAIIQNNCVKEVVSFYFSVDFENLGVTDSPIKGGDGNCEFLSYFIKK